VIDATGKPYIPGQPLAQSFLSLIVWSSFR
jgi:hypothetical protein